MKSSLAELKKVQSEYYRWYQTQDKDSRRRAAEVAAENFRWVLDTAIDYAEDTRA